LSVSVLAALRGKKRARRENTFLKEEPALTFEDVIVVACNQCFYARARRARDKYLLWCGKRVGGL
jgi:hypothetical protein